MPITDLLGAQTLFCRTVAAQSLNNAARSLGMEPAKASGLLTELEAHYGVRLLERTRRGSVATSDGERHFEKWRTQIEELNGLSAKLNPELLEPATFFRVAFPTTTGTTLLMPLLAAFASRHSELEFDVQFTHGANHPLWDGIDLRVVHDEYRREIVREVPLGAVRRMMVASPEYLKTHAPVEKPEDLVRPEIFGARDMTRMGYFVLRNGRREVSVCVRPRVCVRNHAAALQAARQGLGIAVLVPVYLAGPLLENGELQAVLPEWKTPSLPLRAVLSLERKPHPALEAFVDELRTYFAEHEEAA